MKFLEITFKVTDGNGLTGHQLRSTFNLEQIDRCLTGEPLIALAASNEAKKFWESIVLMGYLEKN